tara:strand:+ start:410 stop:982 length:573 start_codon:yes stop_codon:yes gene_type:complete
MNLLFRMIYVWVLSLFRKRLHLPNDASVIGLRVLPNDLDTNLHMNNGRYLTIMDLGRLDLILRTGLLDMMIKGKAVPILSAATIRYRLPLDPFQHYKLHTKLIWWDDKWAYIEQRFIYAKGERAGAVAAIGLVKGNFYNKKRKEIVPIENLLDAIDKNHGDRPEMPAHLKSWIEAEDQLRMATARNENTV